MCVHLPFKYKKAAQALNLFAIENGGAINKLKALKLVFFADRYHLRKYGRPITNDEYYAMPFGPVASGVKDIAEFSDFLGETERDYAEQFIEHPDRYTIRSKATCNEKVFSKSEVDALRYAWEKFGHVEEFALAELTHQYPEWKRHESALEATQRIKMFYEDFFEDPPQGVDRCFDLTPEEKADRLDYLKEISHIEKAWSH